MYTNMYTTLNIDHLDPNVEYTIDMDSDSSIRLNVAPAGKSTRSGKRQKYDQYLQESLFSIFNKRRRELNSEYVRSVGGTEFVRTDPYRYYIQKNYADGGYEVLELKHELQFYFYTEEAATEVLSMFTKEQLDILFA